MEGYDDAHSGHEERFYVVLGLVARGVLFVVYADMADDETIRLISARRATSQETAAYLAFIAGDRS